MAGIGARLRMIRQEWQLSLLEVEERSRRIAEERDDSSYQVSASWLAGLESDEHELTVNRLVALAEIYSIPINRLISIDPGNAASLIFAQLSSPDENLLLAEGPREPKTKPFLRDPPFPIQSPGETTLLPIENAPPRTPYLPGIIGKLDQTLSPMIPAGSVVHVDTSKREIAPKEDWIHEFQRPIYFLKTKDGYSCGWCELDEDSHLTLIPHPLSPASSRRWRYGTEVEILGRVMSVVIRLGE